MKRYININYIRASNLILVSAALRIVDFFLIGEFVSLGSVVALFAITLLFAIGLLVRKGFVWSKWVFSVITMLNLLVIIFIIIPDGLNFHILYDYISSLQILIQVIAVVVLFIPSKQPPIDALEQSDII
ncbi:MAG: hypothetical protein ABIN91_11700 [Mucilaginibacter sp.]|uniref:hypothetical protein n=1 Tax=Mucilaginibacter sp. TaxID=1882438 RepID=UPI00326781E6